MPRTAERVAQSALCAVLIVFAAAAGAVAAQDAARCGPRSNGGYDGHVGCASTRICDFTYCSCMGQMIAPVASRTLCTRALDQSPSRACSTQYRCVETYISCLNNASTVMHNSPNVSSRCQLQDLYLDRVLLATGDTSYAASSMGAKCASTSCRLLAEYANATGSRSCSNGNVNGSLTCISPVTTDITLTIAGQHWATILANASRALAVRTAVQSDLERRLNVSTFVTNVRSGSLISDATLYESPNAMLLAAIAAAAADSSWITSLRAVYAAAGFDPNELSVLGITSSAIPTPAPTPTPTPAPYQPGTYGLWRRASDSDSIECGNACIAGIVVVSLVGLVIIVTLITMAVRMHKCLDDPEEFGTDRVPVCWKNKCAQLGVDPMEYAERINRACATVRHSAEPDLYGLVIAMSNEIVGKRGASVDDNAATEVTEPVEHPPVDPLLAAPLPESSTFAAFYVRREEERQAGVNNKPADRGIFTDLLDPLTKRTDPQTLRKRFNKNLRRSFKELYGIPGDEMLSHALDKDNHIDDMTAEEAIRDGMEALLALCYGLSQRDTAARRERAMFLGFSYDEVAALKRRFAEERSITRDINGANSPYTVTRDRFIAAFKVVRGIEPSDVLVDKLYPTKTTVHHPDDIINNAATVARTSTDRSFSFHYAERKLEDAFRIELAMKFVPFVILTIVYLSQNYGYNESYYATKATAEYVTNEKFPALDEQWPQSCRATGCAFWESVYQDMLVDIALLEDLQNWIQGPLLSRFWPRSTTTAADPISGVNMPVGAIKLRQVRTEGTNETARFNAYLPDDAGYTTEMLAVIPGWFTRTVGGLFLSRKQMDYSSTNVDRAPYGNPAATAHPLVKQAFTYRKRDELNATAGRFVGYDAFYESHGHALIIPFNYTGAEAAAMVQQLFDGGWFDLNSRFFIAEAFIYNRQIQSMTRVRFATELTPGGIIIPQFSALAFPLFHADLYPNIHFGFIALYLIVGLYQVWNSFYVFFWRIPVRVTRSAGLRGVRAHWAAIWHHSLRGGPLLSMLNGACFLAVWALRFYWMSKGVDAIGDEIMQVEHYPQELESLSSVYMTLSYLHAFHVAVITLLVLDYMAMNERFAIVINTIKLASTQLIALFFIFIIGVLSFALAGHLAFGSQIPQYQTMGRSIANTLTAVLGDYEYDAWKQVHVFFTPFYFALLQLILILLLLSMVITVLMDSFEEVMDNLFDPSEVTTIMENDETVAVAQMTFSDRVRHHPITNLAHKTLSVIFLEFKWLVWRLQKCCNAGCCVNPEFNAARAFADLSRRDQYRFWKGVQRSIEYIQFGNVFDAAIGHMHIAELTIPLADGEYDRLPFSSSFDASAANQANDRKANLSASLHQRPGMEESDGDDDGKASHGSSGDDARRGLTRRTLQKFLQAEYGDSLPFVIQLFLELPNYHLQAPSSVLLLSLTEVRFLWRKLIDDYTHGDDDDDSLTPRSANVLIERRKDTMHELAVGAVCHSSRLLYLRRRDFDYGGFYPIISPKQAQQIREDFYRTVESYIGEHKRDFSPAPLEGFSRQSEEKIKDIEKLAIIPFGVTIGDLATILRNARVGARTHWAFQQDEDFTVWMQPFEFRTISERVQLPNGSAYEFVGALSLEAMLESSLDEYHRRKNHLLSLGWSTRSVAVFVRTASTFRSGQPDVHDFGLDKPVLVNDHGARSMAFERGFAAATGREDWRDEHMHKLLNSLSAALEGVTFREFLNYATKRPGEHSQISFFGHFAHRMQSQSGEAFELLWYFVFVILFTIFVVSGRGLGQTANMHMSLSELMEAQQYKFPQVNKSDDQFIYINNLDDWKGFMNDIIIGTVYSHGTNSNGMGANPDLPTTPVGALRVHQLRAKNYDCTDKLSGLTKRDPAENASQAAWYSQRISTFFDNTCVEHLSVSTDKTVDGGSFGLGLNSTWLARTDISDRVKAAFRHRNCGELNNAGQSQNDYYFFPCSGFTLTLPLNLSAATVTSEFSYLMNNDWIDGNTAMIDLEITYFHFGVNAFARWRFQLYFDPSGGLEPFSQVVNFVPFVRGDYSDAYIAFMSIYLFFLLQQFVLFMWTLSVRYREHRAQLLTRFTSFTRVFAKDFWMLINFVAYALFLAVWILRFMTIDKSVWDLEVYDANGPVDDVDRQASMFRTIDILDATTALLTYGRLVSFFQLFPTLGLLGQTMRIALPNMVSLVFIFIVIFWSFVCIGYTLYGSMFWDFASVSRTFSSLSSVLLGDNIDYEELSRLHPGMAGGYYAAFIVICSFVIFNLIIAVLNNAFEEARDKMYNFKPLEDTIEHDAFAKTTLRGVRSSFFINLLFNELRHGFHMFVWAVSYPFVSRMHLKRIEKRFYKNPRFFWKKVTECFHAENPAHAWYRFIDETFDRRDLLGVTSSVAVTEDRIQWQHSARSQQNSPEPRPTGADGSPGPRDPAAAGGVTDRSGGEEDEARPGSDPSAAFNDSLRGVVSGVFARLHEVVYNIKPKQRPAADESRFDHDPVADRGMTPPPAKDPDALLESMSDDDDNDGDGAAMARSLLVDQQQGLAHSVGDPLARLDVRQSFVDDPDEWRVQRVWELFADHMGADASSTWALVRICSDVTGLKRRQLVEWAMQEMNTYQLESKAYDGHTTRRVVETVASLQAIVGYLRMDREVKRNTTACVTDELMRVVAMGRRHHAHAAGTAGDVPEHWRSVLDRADSVVESKTAAAEAAKSDGSPAGSPELERRSSDGGFLGKVEQFIRGDDDAEGGRGVAREEAEEAGLEGDAAETGAREEDEVKPTDSDDDAPPPSSKQPADAAAASDE